MNNIPMRGFIKGDWPFFLFYSLKKGTALLSISAEGIEPFTEVLQPASKQNALFKIPKRFGTEAHIARISIKTQLSSNEANESSGFELHAIGILEKEEGSSANHPRYWIPLPVDLPIGDITVDRDVIRTSNGEEVSYKFFSRSPYTAGSAEFFLFTFNPTQGVVASRVFSNSYENIRANEETQTRRWNGKNWKGGYSLGVHRLQIRTWRGQQNGDKWFGPYYGPQLKVIQ